MTKTYCDECGNLIDTGNRIKRITTTMGNAVRLDSPYRDAGQGVKIEADICWNC